MDITPTTPITVGELVDLLEGVDRSLPVRVEDVHGYRAITGGEVEDIAWNTQGDEDTDVVFLFSMPFEATDAEGHEVTFGVRRETP